jgi:hypothetical protein
MAQTIVWFSHTLAEMSSGKKTEGREEDRYWGRDILNRPLMQRAAGDLGERLWKIFSENAPQAVWGVVVVHTSFRGFLEKKARTDREYRRKQGVNRDKRGRKNQKKSKIRLTEFAHTKHTPVAPVTAFPRTIVPAFLSYPHAGNTVSKEYRCLHNWKKKPCIR